MNEMGIFNKLFTLVEVFLFSYDILFCNVLGFFYLSTFLYLYAFIIGHKCKSVAVYTMKACWGSRDMASPILNPTTR
jgi:hypothetical protein